MKVKKASFPVTPELAAIRELQKADRATRSNKQTVLKCGVVYIITNPAWPGWVSIGCAGDPEERLSQYNRCSPFRDFVCVDYGTTPTKRKSESTVHKLLRSQGINGIKVKHLGEWFFMNEQDAVELVKKICREHSTTGGNA